MDKAVDLTAILLDVEQGRPGAIDELFDVVYAELHGLACSMWKGVPKTDTLQPTALVHEAYAKLLRDGPPSWQNRRHFFFAAARAMRDILVRQARRHAAQRYGNGHQRVELSDDFSLPQQDPSEVLALVEAIELLAEEDVQAADMVRLRFYAGLTFPEIAEIAGVSEATVRRRFAFARAWLHRHLATG